MPRWSANEEVSALDYVKESGYKGSFQSIKAWEAYAEKHKERFPPRKAGSIMEHIRALMKDQEQLRYLVRDLKMITIDQMEDIYLKYFRWNRDHGQRIAPFDKSDYE